MSDVNDQNISIPNQAPQRRRTAIQDRTPFSSSSLDVHVPHHLRFKMPLRMIRSLISGNVGAMDGWGVEMEWCVFLTAPEVVFRELHANQRQRTNSHKSAAWYRTVNQGPPPRSELSPVFFFGLPVRISELSSLKTDLPMNLRSRKLLLTGRKITISFIFTQFVVVSWSMSQMLLLYVGEHETRVEKANMRRRKDVPASLRSEFYQSSIGSSLCINLNEGCQITTVANSKRSTEIDETKPPQKNQFAEHVTVTIRRSNK